LEDFYSFCQRIGPTTSEVMSEILRVCAGDDISYL